MSPSGARMLPQAHIATRCQPFKAQAFLSSRAPARERCQTAGTRPPTLRCEQKSGRDPSGLFPTAPPCGPDTPLQQLQIGLDVGVGGVLGLRLLQQFVGALVVAAQHVGEAFVVEHFDGRANQADHLRIGAVGEIEAAQPVVGGGEPDPGFGVVGVLLDGALEVVFGQRRNCWRGNISCRAGRRRWDRRRAVPGFDNGATGSPLGPGSAGWVTIEPVVSAAAPGVLPVSEPVAALSVDGLSRLEVSSSFFQLEQPARPEPRQTRPAATRIRTRPARILIPTLRNAPCPAPPQSTRIAPSRRGPRRGTRGGRRRTRQARRRWLRNPRQAVPTAAISPSGAQKQERQDGALKRRCLQRRRRLLGGRSRRRAAGGGAAMEPVTSGLAAAAAGGLAAGVASPSPVDVEQPARMPARPVSPAATRIVTRAAWIVITAPGRPRAPTGCAKLSDDG